MSLLSFQSARLAATQLPQKSLSETATHFNQVFREHYQGLCRYAYRITKTRDAAEEVVNDVFLKFWMGGGQEQVHTSVKSFLVRATRNHAIDHLRKQARARNRWYELRGDFDSEYVGPHDMLVGDETNHLIETAIRSLPPQGQRIFNMSRDERKTYGEIARELDLSVKTVEAHMSRSLKQLRMVLNVQIFF